MFRFLKKAPALIISLVLIAIAFVLFAVRLTRTSLNEKLTEIDDPGVETKVEVYRNIYGIPHIVAGSESDLFFALGYCHAEDRLWQMDILRRTAAGRLSEVLGSKAVISDKFMRVIDIRGIAGSVYNGLSKQSKDILRAYSDGVNSFISHNKSRLPFEFGSLGYLPEKWSPVDCILISRLFAFQLSSGFRNDLVFSEIMEYAGGETARALMPESFPFTPRVFDPDKNTGHYKLVDTTTFDSVLAYGSGKCDLGDLNEKFAFLRNMLGIDGSSIGSNAYANRVAARGGEHSYLSNDPHFGVGIPAKWYQVHLSAPGFNVVGASLPGLPLCLLGRNDFISWGITNAMADDCDFFAEKLDSTGNNYFKFQENAYKPLKYYADTLVVKGEPKQIYYMRKNDRSHIISDFHLNNYLNPNGKNPRRQTSRFFKNNAITFNWTGRENSDEVLALYRINKASGMDEFSKALESWAAPALVFVYTDNSGNIGAKCAGLVPVREQNCSPILLNRAEKSLSAWCGYRHLQDKPAMINPPKNYIVSANNEIDREDTYISSYWEPSSRAERIEELLRQTESFTYRDAQFIQNDCQSPYAKNILEVALPVFNKYSNLFTDREKKVLSYIRGWDCILSRKSIAASVYTVFWEKLVYNTLYDELNYTLYKRYTSNTGLVHRKMLELLMKDSKMFDDVRTPREENREYIIFKSFRDACNELKLIFKDANPDTWLYGKMHKIKLEHMFSSDRFIKPSVTIGSFEIGGNSTTINNSEWQLGKSYDAVICASIRFIADMSDTLIYSSLPGGVSGDPFSPNYSDQVQIWLNGGYIKMSCRSGPTKEFSLKTVITRK